MSSRSNATALRWVSERHLRVSFDADAETTRARIRSAMAQIEAARIRGLLNATPAYATILLEFDPSTLNANRAYEETRRVIDAANDDTASSSESVIEIPVCYEGACAQDIEDVSRIHGISVADVVALHVASRYVVRFIGFSPGFAYLDGLPHQLATPRLDAPRVRVPAGSLGIAGDQTGIYPHATAGGWRLIGRTPLTMFAPHREKPALLATGDTVRFTPISLAEFNLRSAGGSTT